MNHKYYLIHRTRDFYNCLEIEKLHYHDFHSDANGKIVENLRNFVNSVKFDHFMTGLIYFWLMK